jgi:hypothetical protein
MCYEGKLGVNWHDAKQFRRVMYGHNGHSIFDRIGSSLLVVRSITVEVGPMKYTSYTRRLQEYNCALDPSLKTSENSTLPTAICIACETPFCFGHLLTHPCHPQPWDKVSLALMTTWAKNARICREQPQYRRE